eukprot:Tbor_TRINITY_DN5240_c0_g1::TRINITY_DN5240_c0_g1_i1::g.16722::m.16722
MMKKIKSRTSWSLPNLRPGYNPSQVTMNTLQRTKEELKSFREEYDLHSSSIQSHQGAWAHSMGGRAALQGNRTMPGTRNVPTILKSDPNGRNARGMLVNSMENRYNSGSESKRRSAIGKGHNIPNKGTIKKKPKHRQLSHENILMKWGYS